MNVLQFRLDLPVNPEEFKKVAEALDNPSFQAVTTRLRRTLNPLNESASYSPLPGSWTGYGLGGTSTVAAEVYSPRGGLVVLEHVSPRAVVPGMFGGGGLLGTLPKSKAPLQITATSSSLKKVNALLAHLCQSIYATLGRSPPDPLMVDPEADFFIEQERLTYGMVLLALRRDQTRFAEASYDDADLRLAQLLTQKDVRDLILRIVQSKNLPEAKLTEELSSLATAHGLSTLLMSDDYLERETLIECRRDSKPIARLVGEPEELTSLSLRCPHCGKFYRDERLSTTFVASSKLKQAIDKSQWMCVLLTSYLVELGVPLHNVFWSVEFGSDEIDLVVFNDGLPWAFELKDREFSVRDAHAFNYRRSVIGPAEAFVVTTDFVSPDAKRVFDDTSANADAWAAPMDGSGHQTAVARAR